MTNTRELAKDLAELFESKGYTWTGVDGAPFVPTVDHLATGLDDLRATVVESLKDAGPTEYVQVEAGRLYVHNRDNVIDVYMHVGELSLED